MKKEDLTLVYKPALVERRLIIMKYARNSSSSLMMPERAKPCASPSSLMTHLTANTRDSPSSLMTPQTEIPRASFSSPMKIKTYF